MRVVQVTKPHLGREVLRLRIRKVVALIDLDGDGGSTLEQCACPPVAAVAPVSAPLGDDACCSTLRELSGAPATHIIC